MDAMDYDSKFLELLKEEHSKIEKTINDHREHLYSQYIGPRASIITNDPKHNFNLNSTEWLTDVYHTTKSGRRIWLGLLIHRKMRPEDNLSLITDPDLLALVEYSSSWYPFALKLNQAFNSGYQLDKSAQTCPYDSKFEFNVKMLNVEGFLGFDFVQEADNYVLLEDEQGIDKPDVLRAWQLDSIPETVEINKVVFEMRKEMIKRTMDEAPLYAFCDIIKYCTNAIDLADPVIRHWLSYFVRSQDFFRFDGKSIHCFKSLLAHKRFEVALSCQRCRYKFSRLDDEGVDCLREGAHYIMVDPIYRSNVLRSHFGDLNQHIFAKSPGEKLVWSKADIESTNFKLEVDQGDADYSQDRYNHVDQSEVDITAGKLRDLGLIKNLRLLLNLQSARITGVNMLKGKVNRMILAMCGYTGTHAATALVKQFKGTKDMGDAVTESFFNRVANNMYDYINTGFSTDGIREVDATADIVFKGGTSSASSTNSWKVAAGLVKYYTPFLTDDDVDEDKVFNSSGGKKLVLTRISHKLKSKNANIITNPANFLSFDDGLFDEVVNAGSRLVRGTRAKRIITPNYGPIYANSLCTVLPAVRLLSRRPRNMLSTTLEGIVGTTYTGALPHDVMAPFMCATTNDPSYFTAAFDFAQFDSSQYGLISEAHASGVERFAKGFIPDAVNDRIGRLDKTSLHRKFHIQAESYRRPLRYKANKIIADAAGVKSGELTTQLRNTATNKAHTDEVIMKFNNKSIRKIRIKSENIIGDDKNIVFAMDDGKPLTEEVAKLLVSVARDVANENHMELSAKRTVVGNIVTEHIKIFVARGYIMQDVFLDSFASEKNSFRGMSYVDRLNTIYDIFMTMLIRSAQSPSLMELMINDMYMLDGLKSGRVTFIPTIGVLFGLGGPEILLGAPEIRGMARFVHRFDVEYFNVISDLYSTLRENSGGKKFASDLTNESGDGLVDRFWLNHFVRKNNYNVMGDSRIAGKQRLLDLTPERCNRRLTDMVLETVKEPLIQVMNDTVSLINIIQRGKLTKHSKPKYHYTNWFLFEFKQPRGVSPYLAADDGVQLVHSIVGLADRNTSMPESVEPVNRLLRKYPHKHPSYIGGIDVLGVLSEIDAGIWGDCLRALDFAEEIIQPLISVVDSVMFRYLHERNVTSTSLYDNTSRTYDLSESNLNRLTHVAPTNSTKQTLGWRFEGMKAVLYMARFGFGVKASYEPTLVNGDEVVRNILSV